MSTMYERDEWPEDFDGKHILMLAGRGDNPFSKFWDVNVLVTEIEEQLRTRVIDVPLVTKGSNNYGVLMTLSDRAEVVVRMARDDVNMPLFEGDPAEEQAEQVEFEAALYNLLRSEPDILASRLLYHRIPVQKTDPTLDPPCDIKGRSLLVFEKEEGENNVWGVLSSDQRAHLLSQSARIRAALFNFEPQLAFTTLWLRSRLFNPKPPALPICAAPTREFCVNLFEAKILATIKNEGDRIGWPDDDFVVGPIAAAAKQSLLRLIPHIMPTGTKNDFLYRLVLEHGDFGIHNMTISVENGDPLITSVFDWETGCILPVILSDPEMAVWVDLTTDETGKPSFVRVPEDATPNDLIEYAQWSKSYFEVLFEHAPEYKHAIRVGKHARHLWFALRGWRGDDPEGYFGALGSWAEGLLKELTVRQLDPQLE